MMYLAPDLSFLSEGSSGRKLKRKKKNNDEGGIRTHEGCPTGDSRCDLGAT